VAVGRDRRITSRRREFHQRDDDDSPSDAQTIITTVVTCTVNGIDELLASVLVRSGRECDEPGRGGEHGVASTGRLRRDNRTDPRDHSFEPKPCSPRGNDFGKIPYAAALIVCVHRPERN